MSATKRAAAPVNDNSTAQPSSQSFAIPSSSAVGDIIVFAMGQNTGTQTFDPPATGGWVPLHDQVVSGTNMASQVWAKKLVAGDPGSSVTFTSTGGGRMTADYLVVQGAGAVTDIVVAAPLIGTTANPAVTPSVTTLAADYYIAEIVFARSALATQTTLSPGSGLTEDAECNTNFATSPNFALGVFHRTANSGAAGSYGGESVTVNQAITGSHAYTLAIPSAGVAPPSGGDTGLRVKIVKEDGSIISVYVYAVQADGSLALLSTPT